MNDIENIIHILITNNNIMVNYSQHLLINTSSIKDALIKLDALAKDAILFIIDDSGELKGSLTDGDVRRGLLKGINIDSLVNSIIQPNPRFIRKGDRDITKVIEQINNNLK